jgi:hypothetical protein
MEEIQKFTGLTKEQIEDAIKKREMKDTVKKLSEPAESNTIKNEKPIEDKLPTMIEVVSLLKDIQEKLNILLRKIT